MLDIKFVRENPDLVKENMKKKFQDSKIPLVNEVLQEDKELRQTQQLRGGQNPVPLRDKSRNQRLRPGRDDKVIGLNHAPRRLPVGNHQLPPGEKLPAPAENRHSGRFQQRGDSIAQLADHIVLARKHSRPVRTDLAGDFDSEFRRTARGRVNLDSRNQCLGRNAADVQTGSAGKRFLDNRRLESALPGPDRGNIPPGTGSDHTNIKFFHGSSPL